MNDESWKELGLKEIDYNSGKQVGTAKTQYTIRNGTRQSTNIAFIRHIRGKRRNLVIKINSRVIKVIIDPITKKVIGVDYVVRDEKIRRQAYATKEIIVSAGSIDSAKLLMLSGIGPKEELLEAKIKPIKHLSVGRNFQEHIGASNIQVVVDKNVVTFESVNYKKRDVKEWITYKSGALTTPAVLATIQFYQSSFESRDGVPDLEMHYAPVVNNFETCAHKSDYSVLPYYNKLRMLPTIIAPKSRGYMKLNQTNPVWGKPLIYPDFYENHHDLEVLKEGFKISNKIINTQAFKKSGFRFERTPASNCEKFIENGDSYYECIAKRYHMPFYHPVGTCKMGPQNDREAVVDPWLKVHGIRGLRVVDGSIMPNIIRGNTNAAVIMIGEKASDIIKQD